VASCGNCGGQRFGVRLVVIADNRVGSHACLTQCPAEEGLCTGAISFVPQQNVNYLPMVINCTIQVAFLLAPEAEYLIHVPPPSQPSPVAAECLR
jgi:hypothetical protein